MKHITADRFVELMEKSNDNKIRLYNSKTMAYADFKEISFTRGKWIAEYHDEGKAYSGEMECSSSVEIEYVFYKSPRSLFDRLSNATDIHFVWAEVLKHEKELKKILCFDEQK